MLALEEEWIGDSVWEYFDGWPVGSILAGWDCVDVAGALSSSEETDASLERFAMLGISARRAVCCTVPACARGWLCSSSSSDRREIRAKG